MTAYDLLREWNSPANTYKVPVSAGKKAVMDNIREYARGAFGIKLSEKVARKIYMCLLNNDKARKGFLDDYYPEERELNWDSLVYFPLCDVLIGSLYDNVIGFIKNADEWEKIRMWNEYARGNGYSCIMWASDIDFNKLFKDSNDAVHAVLCGDFNYSDDYVTFDERGNLNTFPTLESDNSPFLPSELAQWLCDTGKYADYFPEFAFFDYDAADENN